MRTKAMKTVLDIVALVVYYGGFINVIVTTVL